MFKNRYMEVVNTYVVRGIKRETIFPLVLQGQLNPRELWDISKCPVTVESHLFLFMKVVEMPLNEL